MRPHLFTHIEKSKYTEVANLDDEDTACMHMGSEIECLNPRACVNTKRSSALVKKEEPSASDTCQSVKYARTHEYCSAHSLRRRS